VDVRGGCDHKIDDSAARLPAALRDRCGEPAPLSRDRSADRERVERRFDDAEALSSPPAFAGVGRDQRADVHSASEATLIAASTSGGTCAPISTDVSSRTRITRTDR
jgi:hypothetical protein